MPAILAPHEISDALTVSDISFSDPRTGDDLRIAVSGSADDVRSCDLSSKPWEELLVSVEVRLPIAEFKKILPPGSDPSTAAAMTVAVACTPTRFQRKLLLKATTPGQWSGEFVLRRSDVKKAVLVSPRLVRTTNLPSEASTRFATRKGALIGESKPVVLHIEPPRNSPYVGEFDVAWEDFKNSPDSPWRRAHATDLTFVEFTDVTPRLLLNERFAQLKPALESRERGSPTALLRDATAAGVGQLAWLQMFIAAIGSVTVDPDGNPSMPEDEWKAGLLTQGLRVMYPELRDEERLAQGHEDFRSAEGIESFVSRAGSAAQTLTKATRLVDDACLVAAKLTGQSDDEEDEV